MFKNITPTTSLLRGENDNGSWNEKICNFEARKRNLVFSLGITNNKIKLKEQNHPLLGNKHA